VATTTYNLLSVVDASGCPAQALSGSATVTVNPVPDATINPAGPFCSNNAPVTLTAATGGGMWSGTGITNSALGTFDPGVSGPGTFLVQYSVTVGGCTDTKTRNIKVNPVPNATITPAGPFCVTDPTTNLTAATPGGTWSGTGIVNPATGSFDPPTAGVGSHTVSYTVILATGCTDTKTASIVVSNSPNATITPAGPFCTNDLVVNLTAATAGGSWSGTGITNAATGTFNPATAGAGTFTIKYTVTIGSCSDTKTTSIVVNQAPNATITPAGPFCITDAPVTLSAATPGGTWSGMGITNAATGAFNPATAGVGTTAISYSVTSGSCTDTKSINITVANPPNATITPAGPFCTNDLAVNLTAATAGGSWSGTGITNAAAGTFNPATAGAGTFTITHTITIGGCSDTKTTSIVVNQAPDATITPAGPFCVTDAPITLSAVTPGGTWSGTGITNAATGAFNPATAGVGTTAISYAVTSGSCTDTKSINITVANPPNATITPAGPFCSNDLAVNLTAATAGGSWSGTGITNAAAGTFNPATAGAGTFTITYNVVIGGCSDTKNTSIQVNAAPVATITPAGPFCTVNPSVNLTASIPGGTWSGTGITNAAAGTFDPATAGVGTFTISYTVTSGGCTTMANTSITVNASCGGFNCGTFTVTVTDTRPSCSNQNDGVIKINVSGGTPNYVVTLTDGGSFNQALPGPGPLFTFTNLSPANYQYTIKDAAGNLCTLPHSLPIMSTVQASASNFVNAVCFNKAVGGATVTVTSGGAAPFEYSINGGTSWIVFTSPVTINNLMPSATPYSILVRDDATDLCPAQVMVTINNALADIDAPYTITNATCNNNDGSLKIGTITGGTPPYTYVMDGVNVPSLPANNTFTSLTGGAHLFTVIDANSCRKDFPIIITFPGLVNFTVGGINPDCTGNGTNGQLTVTVTSVGSFQVGMSMSPVSPPVSFQSVVSAGNSTVTFNGLGMGTYYITAKSVNAQCPTVTRTSLTAGPIAVDLSLTVQDILCFENKGGITLTGIVGSSAVNYKYQILNLGNIVQSGVITPLQALADVLLTGLNKGDYQIQLTQDQSAETGCSGLITSAFKPFKVNGPTGSLDTLYVNRTVSVPDLATGTMLMGIRESGQEPYEVRLELTQPLFPMQFYLLDWTAATRNPQNLKVEYNATKLFGGVYNLSLRDALGCRKDYTVAVNVNTDVFIPNIFTPNSDGVNDVFFIRNLPAEANIIITNRWGKEVYRSGHYKNDWAGINADDGIYYYRIQAGGQIFNGWLEIQRGLGQP
jgi:gliding motility-associated-like protein